MSAWDWIAFGRNELALFAAVFFLFGAIDEIAIDLIYFSLLISGKKRTGRVDEAALLAGSLAGRAAVFIPAWQESAVIGATLNHMLGVWPTEDMTVFVGCYRNDPATLAAARKSNESGHSVQIVACDADGPTCKADCLNHLYRAMRDWEHRSGQSFYMIVLHDAEDMVDPCGLALLGSAMKHCEFAQLPVLALPQRSSQWIAGHYSDEFAESHAKTMIVRQAIGSAIPGAGVGCAIERTTLDRLNSVRSGRGPFSAGALTEDYELGLTVGRVGGRGCFLRTRTTEGRLIATRAFFPSTLTQSVRQKARWVHGIALQGWDRLGWHGGPIEFWMNARDRRGPFPALLLSIAYMLLIGQAIELGLHLAGWTLAYPVSPTLRLLLLLNLLALIWRATLRAIFTAREFGVAQGLLAIPRIVVSNAIAILAGRRALVAYVGSLRGAPFHWDKTDHQSHPSMPVPEMPSR